MITQIVDDFLDFFFASHQIIDWCDIISEPETELLKDLPRNTREGGEENPHVVLQCQPWLRI